MKTTKTKVKRKATRTATPVQAKSKSKRGTLRVLVANGVNLDLLGQREPGIYGQFSLADVEAVVREYAESQGAPIELVFFQSNDEGEFLEALTGTFNGIVINPGAWTHTSLALGDRLKALRIPYVEVHISNTLAREAYRHQSFISAGAAGVVIGFGIDSYRLGMEGLMRVLSR